LTDEVVRECFAEEPYGKLPKLCWTEQERFLDVTFPKFDLKYAL